MKLLDIVYRHPVPDPWVEGEKIPWSDADFSRRMLKEHLSQAHDAASRRFAIIDMHVRWIHEQVLKGKPRRILDLGCGPGLYTSRLAKLGHRCVGIDYAPAAIAYATEQVEDAGLACSYRQQDIRTAEYGEGYGLVMLLFGEFNLFRPAEARTILQKASRALLPGGFLLLEPHTFEAVRRMAEQPATWYSAEGGLFSDQPHLCLQENLWNAARNVAIERYHIILATTGEVTRHSASIQAYTRAQYRALLVECDYEEVQDTLSWNGGPASAESDLFLMLSQKRGEA